MGDEEETVKVAHPKRTEELIGRANDAAMRIERANAELKKLLDRQQGLQEEAESVRVQDTLAGKAEASQAPKKPLSDEEYAQRVMRGETPQ